MAIAAGYGSSDKSEGTLSVSNNGATERQYSATIAIDAWDVNLISGYRTSKSSLYYLNTYYSTYKSEGKLISELYPSQNARGTSRSYGALLGMRYTFPVELLFIQGEVGATHARWEKNLDTTSFTTGVSGGVQF